MLYVRLFHSQPLSRPKRGADNKQQVFLFLYNSGFDHTGCGLAGYSCHGKELFSALMATGHAGCLKATLRQVTTLLVTVSSVQALYP